MLKEIKMEQKFTLELVLKDANTVLQALSQLPYAQVVELIENIKAQASRQLQPEQPPAEAE